MMTKREWSTDGKERLAKETFFTERELERQWQRRWKSKRRWQPEMTRWWHIENDQRMEKKDWQKKLSQKKRIRKAMTKKIKKKKAMTARDDKAVTQRKWSTDEKERLTEETFSEKEN